MKINIAAVNKVPGSSRNYKTGTWRTMKPIVNLEKCKRCMKCEIFCPEASIHVRKDEGGAVVNYDFCKGCGICAHECPFDAIVMVSEEK